MAPEPWVLLQRDTPKGVAEFADDALEASRAALRAASGLAPAPASAPSPAPAPELEELKSTPSTPRDRHGRRRPRRRPRTDREKAQEAEWQAIQAQDNEHKEQQRLQADVKAVWGEHFRASLAAEGNKAGQRAGLQQLENEAEYTRATTLSEKKRSKAASAREARRMHDLAALDAWRQKQSGAASAAADKEQQERSNNEAQWRAIQAKKKDQQQQRKSQKQIIKHRSELARRLRAVETAAASAGVGGGGAALQPGGRRESEAWSLSPQAQHERWQAVQSGVREEARKAKDESMRQKLHEQKERLASKSRASAGGDGSGSGDWARWPTCTDRARSSPQVGAGRRAVSS
jgi:hypothetical protein